MSPSHPLAGWKPPVELDLPLPRPVRLTNGGILLYAVSALLLVVGAAGALWFAQASRDWQVETQRMRAKGRWADAAVTRLWRDADDSGDYHMDYKFTADGRQYEGHATVEGDYWARLHELSPLIVRYLASDPAHHYLIDFPPSAPPVWLAFFAGGVIVITGAVPALAVRRQRHLLKEGRPAPATVTRLRNLRSQHGERNMVSYQFALPGGGIWQGRSRVQGRSVPLGSVICVLYDPHYPHRNAAYPLRAVRLGAN
jgi:hypothetical protein